MRGEKLDVIIGIEESGYDIDFFGIICLYSGSKFKLLEKNTNAINNHNYSFICP